MVDSETYKNLLMIKQMNQQEFESLDLYFEYASGKQAEELVFNGCKRKVKYEERYN